MAEPQNLDSLIEYPVDFPIKIMGKRHDDFANTMVTIVLRHAPDWDSATLEMRPSKSGSYLSLTATIRAVNRQQLDALYTELSGHPMVSVVL
ncbi:YbeD family protein [Derxia gummosa]|uniref:UPF0250 protein n=1 Tax=Derxia gummosa DSM 723 TaxID=1121388 RepID=A0A8B6X1Q8_9BURK|nr:DUF493 family protein [Derxia gummosa]